MADIGRNNPCRQISLEKIACLMWFSLIIKVRIPVEILKEAEVAESLISAMAAEELREM